MPVRPALVCTSGLLKEGDDELHVTMAHVIPGIDTEWYCCSESGLTCSIALDTPHVTAVPEFDFFFGILAGAMLIGVIYERAWERRTSGTVRGVRFAGQRGPVRRWLRKMFRSQL